MHKYIVLSNPESENFGEVTGYLKLSITIAGGSDNAIQIEDDPNPDVEDILAPPEIKPEFYQLYIKIFAGQHIVPLDKKMIGKNSIDAYIRMDYKTSKLKTKILTQEEGGEVRWN